MLLLLHFNKESIKDQSCPPWIVQDPFPFKQMNYFVHEIKCENVSLQTTLSDEFSRRWGYASYHGAIYMEHVQLRVVKEGDRQIAYITPCNPVDSKRWTELDTIDDDEGLTHDLYMEYVELEEKLFTPKFI